MVEMVEMMRRVVTVGMMVVMGMMGMVGMTVVMGRVVMGGLEIMIVVVMEPPPRERRCDEVMAGLGA